MVLVTGASGFVGSQICKMRGDAIPCPSLRGASEEQVRRIVEESGADAIIHTAALADIGTCEKNPDASYHANVLLPLYLARAAGGRKLVCFSSDQVYSGLDDDGPYTEERVKGANLYAAHKLEMEARVLDVSPDAVMLRAEWMYGNYEKKPNYFMLATTAGELRFSSQSYRGITYVREVAEQMENVLHLAGGVYNFGSETEKSMYEITREFLDAIGRRVPLYDAPAGHNLWMNCAKAREGGVIFRSVEQGLRLCAADCGLLG
jgi:dTDP-4-dehydrorhamnose reductase